MRPFIQFSSRNIQKSKEYYLAFQIGDDNFAANFPKIAGFSKEFTFVPYVGNVPFITGTAYVNNEPVIVVNLKNKIGMEYDDCPNTGRIIIVENELFGTNLKFAFLYNTLGDAFEIPENKLMPTPNVGKQYELGHITGVHVQEDNCILIIDIENLFNIDDLIDIMVEYNRNKK